MIINYTDLYVGIFFLYTFLLLIVRCMKIYKCLISCFQFVFMDIKERIGFRLRELRTAKGLSQEKFSFECELDRTYIASIERGKRNVSIINIEKISKALDMSVSDFFNSNLFQ